MISYDLIKDVFDMENPLTLEYFELCSTSYEGKGEKHHILPKSIFPEYTKEPWNVVNLDLRTHYICHEYLAQMCISSENKKKMTFAWHNMCHTRASEFVSDAETYTKLKVERSKFLSELPRTEQWKSNISKSHKGRIKSEDHRASLSKSRKGMSFTESHKLAIANAWTDERRNQRSLLSKASKGVKRSEECIKNLSESRSLYSYVQYLDGNLVRVFARLKDCLEAGFNKSNIVSCCNGKSKTHRGFTWFKIPKINNKEIV